MALRCKAKFDTYCEDRIHFVNLFIAEIFCCFKFSSFYHFAFLCASCVFYPLVRNMAEESESPSFLTGIINEILGSYLNIALIGLIAFLLYKIVRSSSDVSTPSAPPEPQLPKIRKDFTIQELKEFDGNQPDGRVLVAVNGSVYDVTKGKRFYGPGKFIFCSTHDDNVVLCLSFSFIHFFTCLCYTVIKKNIESEDKD